MLTFRDTSSNSKIDFENLINVIDDKKLIKEFKSDNIKNQDSTFVIESANDLPIFDTIQIKVNVKNVGFFTSNFDKANFDEKTREELLQKIVSLKDKNEPTEETQKVKVRKLLEILSTYKPIYIAFANTKEIKISSEELKNISEEIKLESLILYLKISGEKTTTYHQVKKSSNKLAFLSRFKHQKQEKVESEEEKVEKKELVVTKINYRKFLFEYIFQAIFLFIATNEIVLGLAYAFNQDAVAIFLLIISVIFFGLFGYDMYVYQRSLKENFYSFDAIKFNICSMLTGNIIGIGIGFIISYFVIKAKEGITLNYSMIMGISIAICVVSTIIAFFSPIVVRFIISKIKDYKMKNEGDK